MGNEVCKCKCEGKEATPFENEPSMPVIDQMPIVRHAVFRASELEEEELKETLELEEVLERKDSVRRRVSYKQMEKGKYNRAARSSTRGTIRVMWNEDNSMYAFVPRGKVPINTLALYPDVQPIPPHAVVRNFTWSS